MNWRIAFLVTAMMVATGLFTFAGEPGQGEVVTTFTRKGGPTEEFLKLNGQGSEIYDPHAYFEIEKNVPLSSASMKIENLNADTGPWVDEPVIDLGLDGNDDWKYSGVGYGQFGRSTVFADDTTVKTNSYSSAQNKNLGDVLIPQEAKVLSAKMEVRGRFEASIPAMSTIATGGSISYSPMYLRFGDITKDGKNDVIISTAARGSFGYLYSYVYKGLGDYTKTRINSISYAYDFVLHDMDQDNDLDIVYTTGSYIYWAANDGTGSFTTINTLDTTFACYYLETVDMNKDSEKEIIAAKSSFSWGSSSKAIVMYKRYSGSTFYQWPLFDTGSGSGSSTLISLKVGDWNDDDYNDVYAAYSDYKVYTFENPAYVWYYNDTTNISSKTKWTAKNVFTSSYYIRGFDVGDVDKDGKADVVVALDYYYGVGIYYYNNGGTSTWSRYSIVTGSTYYPQSVSLADLTNDGYLDVFFTFGTYSYYNRVGWCTGGSSPNKNSWTTKDLLNQQSASGSNAFSGDVDSDGRTDVGCFFTGSKQAIVWMSKSPYDGSNIEPTYIEDGGLVSMSDLEKCDLDEDGDDDFLITAYTSGTVGWYENDGTPFTDNWLFHRINTIMVGGAKEVAFGDIDGDGDLDVACTAYDSGQVMWFENKYNNPKSTWTYHYVGGHSYIFGCGVGDADKDGIMEIFTSDGYYYGYGVRMWYANDPKGTWSYKQISANDYYCGAINITDMNKDGYIDVIATVNGWSGNANIYRNPMPKNPRTTAWTTINTVSGLQYPYEAIPFDINNDGNLDVVASANWGGIKWAQCPKNRNSTSGWTSYTIDTSISYAWGLDVTDLDNDGFADIFVTSHYWWWYPYYVYGRGLYWLEETDSPTNYFTKRTMDTTLSESYGVVSADLDRNGQQEIYAVSMINDLMKVSKPTLNYPSNLRIDLGSDGNIDWTYPGSLKYIVTAEFSTELQNVLSSKPPAMSLTTDSFGNKMAKLPVMLYSGTLGRLTCYGIDIRYNVTFTLDNNGKIRESLSRLIPDYPDPADPMLRIYVLFMGRSEGTARLFDLQLEYNAPPKQVQPLPASVKVSEDSMVKNVLDLSKYFKDDYDAPQMLKYQAQTTGPFKDKLSVMIENGANLTIDCTITKDFDRDVTVRFIATDNGGPGGVPPRSLVTKEITIDVQPKNDPPVLGNGTLPKKVEGLEGQEVTVLDLSKMYLFQDPDDPTGSSISYYAILDPLKQSPLDLSHLTAEVKGKKLIIRSEGDWYGSNIPLRIYGYDFEMNPNTNPFHMTFIDVKNINDPPYWTGTVEVKVDEDTFHDEIVDLSSYVMDIDTAPKDMHFSLLSQTNNTYYRIILGTAESNLVSLEPRIDNWFGDVEAEFEVTDGEFTATSSIKVTVMPVNDRPTVNIISPIEDQWIEPGEISIIGEASDIEEVNRVEVFFLNKWHVARGTNSWGITLTVPDFGEKRENVPIQVRAIDNYGEVVIDHVNITIVKKIIIPPTDLDGDGVPNALDKFPYDPSEWSDRDNDGWGDNIDEFPDKSDWWRDFDKDGVADQADTDPFNPALWSDTDHDGYNQGETPPDIGGDGSEQEGKDWTVPILLYVLAILALAATILAGFMYVQKRNASKDPRRSVEYYNKMEKRRVLFRKMMGRDAIESLLGKTQIKDVTFGRPGARPKGQMVMPARAGPLLPPVPSQGIRPQLPPVQTPMQNRGPLPPPGYR